jgi:low affinity Fe/Cu permease
LSAEFRDTHAAGSFCTLAIYYNCVAAADYPMSATNPLHSAFQRFAVRSAELVGSWSAFMLAVAVILLWAATGHLFHYSDTWQLWINTGTTIVTFLMVFLIQYTQNRDAKAMHLKLDELLRAIKGARTEMINLKNLSDEEIEKLEKAFDRLARYAGHARMTKLNGKSLQAHDTGSAEESLETGNDQGQRDVSK